MAIITPHDPKTHVQMSSAGSVAPRPTETRQGGTVEGTTQVPPKEVTEAPKEAPDPKLLALAQREKQIREAQRKEKEALAAEKAAIEAQKAEIEQVKAWRAKFASDPWSALIEAGYSPEQATELMLNQPKSQDVQLQKLQSELQSLRTEHEKTAQAMKDAQAQQYEQAKKQIGNEVKLLVDSDPEFETIKAMDAQDAVTEYIEAMFNETGVLLPIDRAAREVEEYLLNEAERLASIKKLQARLNPPQEQKAPTTQKLPGQTTLTNRVTAPAGKPQSARERAIAAFMGQNQT